MSLCASTMKTRQVTRPGHSRSNCQRAHTLTFDSVDHEPKTIQITMPLSKPIRVYLEPIAAPLEIVVEAFTPSPHVSKQSVDAEMAYETPGTHDDSVRLVQLPGVMVQREFAPSTGDVSVRASRPRQSVFLMVSKFHICITLISTQVYFPPPRFSHWICTRPPLVPNLVMPSVLWLMPRQSPKYRCYSRGRVLQHHHGGCGCTRAIIQITLGQ